MTRPWVSSPEGAAGAAGGTSVGAASTDLTSRPVSWCTRCSCRGDDPCNCGCRGGCNAEPCRDRRTGHFRSSWSLREASASSTLGLPPVAPGSLSRASHRSHGPRTTTKFLNLSRSALARFSTTFSLSRPSPQLRSSPLHLRWFRFAGGVEAHVGSARAVPVRRILLPDRRPAAGRRVAAGKGGLRPSRRALTSAWMRSSLRMSALPVIARRRSGSRSFDGEPGDFALVRLAEEVLLRRQSGGPS